MKRRQVVFSPEALGDLYALYDWIAERTGDTVAAAYLDRLRTYCLGFEVASQRGRSHNRIRRGLRTVGFERRVTIAFAVDEARVTILRLFYGGQDWPKAFE